MTQDSKFSYINIFKLKSARFDSNWLIELKNSISQTNIL